MDHFEKNNNRCETKNEYMKFANMYPAQQAPGH